jgi:O-antigen/teichoic acid export membrane protein
MRVQKASINVLVNVFTFIIGILPSFIVRKIFLDSLGNELLGLSSLYTNILGLISLVELGIGSAIIYALYKPFAEEDRIKVKGYLNFYSKFYRIVGIIIFVLGALLLPFLSFFIKDDVYLLDAQLYFILFLINTLISYLFSYKLCILNVAQEAYKVSIALTISKLLMSILQAIALYFYPNFYLYLFIQLLINLLFYIAMNLYIDNKHKWIKNTVGDLTSEERSSLIKNVKAIFLHKIGGIFIFGTDNLIISYYINLTVVGIFNSYYMVIAAAQAIISNALSGVTASIGNLLTEGNKENAYKVHKRLFFISFWIVSFITISLFNTLEQFVHLWLGENQVLDRLTIYVLLINLYIFLMRGSIERFSEGGGIFYQDRFAPLVESAINLIASIILVKTIGLPGVFLGTVISNLSVVFWVKPKLVYKYIFKVKLRDYFIMYFKYFSLGLVPLGITTLITNSLKGINNVIFFGFNCIINVVLINLIYLIVFRKNEEYIYFKNLAFEGVKKLGFRKGEIASSQKGN